jgi:CubicO group peptidase (beta-lactamase class C family)
MEINRALYRAGGTATLLCAALIGLARSPAHQRGAASSQASNSANSDGKRTILTHNQLFTKNAPSAPVDDVAAFALPANAEAATESFEGTLALNDLQNSGNFTALSDVFQIIPDGDSPWKHLPPFRYQFVASGEYLIPAQQGLTITGSSAWNYILGPGRVWREAGDDGYMRASLPFALVQRNQNCVHNGEMAFLYSKTKSPKISNVYFQITQETCYPMKFNLWGMAAASYEPADVPRAAELKNEHATELAHRLPTKMLDALMADHPSSGINLAAIPAEYKNPAEITTYGIVLNGVNYSSGCPTRSGEYAFCADMRLPSYSIAKSVFAGVALMRLGQLYGSGVYSELIANYIPKAFIRGNWEKTTFNNVSDMATGNYNLDGYEADEDSPTMDTFLVDETFDSKLSDAFAFTKNYAPPGTKWIYQSSATFILTQAMNAYLKQRRGGDADIFELVRDDVYKPLQFSAGGLTTIRTGNSPSGAPSGYYGLFFIKDDVAKIAEFLNNSQGQIHGAQILEPSRLNEALYRANTGGAGVPILGASSGSALGPPKLGRASGVPENNRRYAHGFWGRHITPEEFPRYKCDFWISLMAGYGGNIVILLPNGATFYIFSDGREFPWVDAVHEINKLSPTCH